MIHFHKIKTLTRGETTPLHLVNCGGELDGDSRITHLGIGNVDGPSVLENTAIGEHTFQFQNVWICTESIPLNHVGGPIDQVCQMDGEFCFDSFRKDLCYSRDRGRSSSNRKGNSARSAGPIHSLRHSPHASLKSTTGFTKERGILESLIAIG